MMTGFGQCQILFSYVLMDGWKEVYKFQNHSSIIQILEHSSIFGKIDLLNGLLFTSSKYIKYDYDCVTETNNNGKSKQKNIHSIKTINWYSEIEHVLGTYDLLLKPLQQPNNYRVHLLLHNYRV